MYLRHGVHVMVDGQFGSTGKGLFASWIAAQGSRFDLCVTNGGPNSGHTFYYNNEKHVLKQLPTYAAYMALAGHRAPVYISAGAAVNPEILNEEAKIYGMPIYMSPQAALIDTGDRVREYSSGPGAPAGTRQGVGRALARKVLREPSATVSNFAGPWARNIELMPRVPQYRGGRIFVEVSQGFSLGVNSNFYPAVTSRECTVAQALADARIAPQLLARAYMVIRTFPIRVGNVGEDSSGGCYSDQEETTWEELDVTEELTTVTKRVRRVFTFSTRQFVEAMDANAPHVILVNFMNYIKEPKDRVEFAEKLKKVAFITMGRMPKFYYGFGPYWTDIKEDPRG